MRLNFGRRLVLFIHWLLSLAGCALAVTLVVWPKCLETALALLERQGLAFKVYAIAVLVVYLIFAVGAACIICGGKKKREKIDFIVVDSSETGRTRIAVSAVDQMIRQAVRGVDGIAELKANIINNDDSIDIAADVAIRNGTHVPTVTANIQRAIRGYIEHNCGVAVRGVSVSVHSLAEVEENGRRGHRKKTKVAFESKPTAVPNETRDYGKPDWSEPVAPPMPEISPADEPEEYVPEIEPVAPVDVPDEPVEESEAVIFGEDEPVSLTLDPAPDVPAEDAADTIAGEESETAAEDAPAAEEAPTQEAAPAQKKRRFGKLFGKRDEPDAPAAPEDTGGGTDAEA